MITDLFLKAADQKTLGAALLSAEMIDAKGNPTSETVCIDRIETIARVTGYDAQKQPIVSTEAGYHCNVRILGEPSARR